jgi:hypothetical protein
MTAQKLYEKLILMTVKIAEDGYDENVLTKIVNTLPDKYTFEQVCIHSDLHGVHIPQKEDFVNWGEDYLLQCLSTILNAPDYSMLDTFLNAVFSIPKLKKLIGERFVNLCYDAYIDNVLSDHDIANRMSETILHNLTNYEDRFKDFYRIAHATGVFSGFDYIEFLKLDPYKKK